MRSDSKDNTRTNTNKYNASAYTILCSEGENIDRGSSGASREGREEQPDREAEIRVVETLTILRGTRK